HRPGRAAPPAARDRHRRRRGFLTAKSPNPPRADADDDQRHRGDPTGVSELLSWQPPPELPVFFLSLLIEGALAGAIYALVALVFVLVYKSSRMINFALGEWIMAGALLAGVAQHAIGLGPGLDLAAGIVFAALAMAAFGIAFNAIVVQRLLARPAISLIMVTI